MTPGSDPVAASRFIEAFLRRGWPSLGSQGPTFKVPEASQLRWLFLHRLDLGRKGSLFVGRSATGRAFVVSTFEQEMMAAAAGTDQVELVTNQTRAGSPHPASQSARGITGQGGLDGLMFWDPNSSLICLGNAANTLYSGVVSVPSRSKSFSTAASSRTRKNSGRRPAYGASSTA